MKSHQRWIWELPDWPSMVFDAQHIQTRLAAAKKSQGLILGKAEMIGLEGLQLHIHDSLTQEALTTSAIEGEKLDPESVRSSVAKRLGLDASGAPLREGQRNIEGLIDVLQDATLNTESPLTLERLCHWHGALFPTGFSGMHRIVVGSLRSMPMQIVSGAVGSTKVHYAAPPAQELVHQVKEFLTEAVKSEPCSSADRMESKQLFNQNHDIKIFGYEVELYAQDSDESHFSTGVYSVKNDEWITAPSKEKSQIDREVFKTKINSWKEKIENLIKNIKKDGIKSSEKQIDSLKEKLKDYRKSGLEKEGEYSYENLVFKYLRRSKLIEKLYNTIVKQTDKELSVETRKIE